MTPTAQLYSLCELNGNWTSTRLKKLGITEAAINRGQQQGILRLGPAGAFTLAERWKRVALKTRLAEELKPGEEVVKMKDGHPIKVQAIKDDGGKVAFVDPERIEDGIQDAETDQLTTKEGAEEIDRIFA